MSIEYRTAHRTPSPTADELLDDALERARLAYEFAPGSYTFGALTAVSNAIARLHAPDWIAEFIAYENSGTSVFTAGPLEGTPGNLPTECVNDESGSASKLPRESPPLKSPSRRRASIRFQRTAGPA